MFSHFWALGQSNLDSISRSFAARLLLDRKPCRFQNLTRRSKSLSTTIPWSSCSAPKETQSASPNELLKGRAFWRDSGEYLCLEHGLLDHLLADVLYACVGNVVQRSSPNQLSVPENTLLIPLGKFKRPLEAFVRLKGANLFEMLDNITGNTFCDS